MGTQLGTRPTAKRFGEERKGRYAEVECVANAAAVVLVVVIVSIVAVVVGNFQPFPTVVRFVVARRGFGKTAI